MSLTSYFYTVFCVSYHKHDASCRGICGGGGVGVDSSWCLFRKWISRRMADGVTPGSRVAEAICFMEQKKMD